MLYVPSRSFYEDPNPNREQILCGLVIMADNQFATQVGQAATDLSFDQLRQGACGCCIAPLFEDIKYKKHQMKLKYRSASVCCKPLYLPAWCLAFWITRTNKACFVCLAVEAEATDSLKQNDVQESDEGAALLCCIQACFLSFFPLACMESVCLNACYYSCLMCMSEAAEDNPNAGLVPNRSVAQMTNLGVAR